MPQTDNLCPFSFPRAFGNWPCCLFLACATGLFAWTSVEAQAQPTPFERLPNTSLHIKVEEPQAAYSVEDLFADAGFTFDRPVAVATEPGNDSALYIVEQTGRIWLVPDLDNPARVLFLDLSDKVIFGGEQGLLALALHPDFATNRRFFVWYTVQTDGAEGRGRYDRLSRFETLDDDPPTADLVSEVVLIEQKDDAANHNGGDLHFGPDGYLYLSLGDEGGANDDYRNSQKIDRDFFAGMIRIDVDEAPDNLQPNPHPAVIGNYRIPADNPYIGATTFDGDPVEPAAVRTEFYAVGLRNPWRFSFDPVTAKLYCGDVGQNRQEEISTIEKGGNYGWFYREGTIATPGISKEPPADAEFIDPVYTYSRDLGRSVTGGVVYRGDLIAPLYGQYIFGDFVTSTVWVIPTEGAPMDTATELLQVTNPSGFGYDPRDGEALIVSYAGTIYKLTADITGEQVAFPEKLSETGVFTDLSTLQPTAGILPYTVNAPFWSDYAIKTRWFSIPEVKDTITFSEEGPWNTPVGTVWIKHFDLEMERFNPETARRVETRLLVRTEQGATGATYEWNEEGTDATLVPAEGKNLEFEISLGSAYYRQTYILPSRGECLQCHNGSYGWGLSFNTRQLNLDNAYGEGADNVFNQLVALHGAGYFAADTPTPDPTSLKTYAALNDTTKSIEHRTRSYLAVNCSQCHTPNGTGRGFFDTRIETPLADAGIINGPLLTKRHNPTGAVIVPGDEARSELLQRIRSNNSMPMGMHVYRMPPLATRELNHAGIEMIENWIAVLGEDRLFEQSQAFENGLKFSPWLGWYNDTDYPWIFHFEHGWEWIEGPDPENIWMWDSQLGWLFTGASVYPFLYSAEKDSWLYYDTQTTAPRWFFEYASGEWIFI